MSNDIMPCGCEGHMDDIDMCKYPGSEAALSAERKRREGLEDELHQERLAHTSAITRAEQAERERDETRRIHGKSVLDGSAAVSRAERAEADNAALLDSLKTMTQGAYTLGDLGMARARVANDHPGAALLERMQAAEALRPLAAHDEACQKDIGGRVDSANCATCAYDVLNPETK